MIVRYVIMNMQHRPIEICDTARRCATRVAELIMAGVDTNSPVIDKAYYVVSVSHPEAVA